MTSRVQQCLRALTDIAPARDAETAGTFRAKQLAAIARLTVLALAGNLLNVLIVWHALRSWVEPVALLAWLASALVVIGLGARSWWRSRLRPPAATASHRALDAVVRNAVMLALVWALVPALFFSRSEPEPTLLISIVSAGMFLGGAFILATVPRAALTYVAIVLGGCLVGLSRDGFVRNLDLILLLTVYAGVVVAAVTTTARVFGARLMAEAEAQHQKELVSLLLKDFESNTSDWLWESDHNGSLRHVSDRMRQVFRIQPDLPLTGESLPTLLRRLRSDDNLEDSGIRKLESRLLSPTPFRELTVCVEHDGSTHWWSLTAAPLIDRNGRHTGWRGVGTDISERRHSMSELARLANSDSLTGLANRHALRSRLAAWIETSGDPFALLYFDLDNFKHVNDSLGHGAGDELLQHIAARLRSVSRTSDTLARLGGDEFAVVCLHMHGAHGAAQYAERLLDTIRAPFHINGRTLHVGSSVGIAMFPEHGRTVDELLRNSDMALYAAKNAGRNTWRFFHEDLGTEAMQRLALQSDLVRAIEQNQLVLHYQPQVNLRSGRVSSFEALVRWQHPQHGLITPGRFIPIAEECGLIVPIGNFVLRQACLDAAGWPGNARVAVNVSAMQFSRSDLLQEVGLALRESRLPPERLEIEVTESVLIDDDAGARRTLAALRAQGIGVVLDDFGTGYSSLAYLRDYPLTKLKIDRSFVASLCEDAGTLAIVRSVVLLTEELHLDFVAEGVESLEEQATLLKLGCQTGQGYLFSAPLPSADLDGFLADQLADDAATGAA